MPTITKEAGEYTLFDVVNSLVSEARRNDGIRNQFGEDEPNSDFFSSTGRLLQSLTHQAPNRIYFSPDGKVSRVLFFSEKDRLFQARLETLELKPTHKLVKSEVLSSSSPRYLEQEIDFWRRRFCMNGDLLLTPDAILKSLNDSEDLVHVGKTPNGLVYCRYYISVVNGPRLTDLGIGDNYRATDDEEFVELSSPPNILSRYANPFSSPLPR